jgi:hypothetical protein
MEHAREMAQGDQRGFWQGYCRGLLRGFLGPCTVRDEWHSRMLERGAFDESALAKAGVRRSRVASGHRPKCGEAQ